MDNYDPIKVVQQLRDWVEDVLSSFDITALAEAKKRYRNLNEAIKRIEQLNYSIPENMISELTNLEEILSTQKKMHDLARELHSLYKDITYQIKAVQSRNTSSGKKAPPKTLRVTFPDGTVICENKSISTFIRAIQYIGLERVSKLESIRTYGHPLVSNNKSGYMRPKKVDGYFIETHSSTNAKANYILRIAKLLDIDIKVEVLD